VVLFVACANVANLLLVRSESKDVEMAVRTAMGADRHRIRWEYVKEGLVLVFLGGLLGLLLAQVGLRVFLTLARPQLPRLDEVTMSAEVVLFTLAISLTAGVVLGLIPAMRRPRRLAETLRQGGPSGTRSPLRRCAQSALVICQIALTLLVLVASGLLLRTFLSLRNVDTGLGHPEEVLALRINIPASEARTRDEVARLHERIAQSLAGIPGVSSVALTSSVPMDGNRNHNPLYLEDQPLQGDEAPDQHRHEWIGGGYLETLQTPLVAGRTLTWEDVHDRSQVAMVSVSLARRYWNSPEAALGKRISVRPDPIHWYEIVGVVGDVRDLRLGDEPIPAVYWPQVTMAFWQGSPADEVMSWRSMSYAIRSPRVGESGLQRDVRNAVWAVNRNLPLRGMAPISELSARSMADTSLTLSLMAAASGVVFLLGIIGVYGVLSYTVAQRSRELGVRIALGAGAGEVQGMVLRQGIWLSAAGILIGLLLACSLTHVMTGMLYGVRPVDPLSYLLVTALVLAVTTAASYLPARRAARVNPIIALRTD
jgi:predicted permease